MLLFGRGLRSKADEAGADVPAPVEYTGLRRPKIGLALGAGAARGWSHIGVVKALNAAGIRPDIIAGASIGAVVGGCYVAGKLADLEDFARSLTKRRMFTFMDLTFSGAGLISGGRLKSRLELALGDLRIEDLETEFAAVATEMGTGHEIWLNKGPLIDALRASYALPGIFEPVNIGGRWLFDGALVNPIPVSVCRAMGAEVVIAANLNPELRRPIIGDHALSPEAREEAMQQSDEPAGVQYLVKRGVFRRLFGGAPNNVPGIATAMVDAFNITQDRITRSRLAGDPPDILINTRLGNISFFDFHRARECMDIGEEAVQKTLPEIAEILQLYNIETG